MQVPELTLELWPSIDELTESKFSDDYLGCATEFWRSIGEFQATAENSGLLVQEVRGLSFEPTFDDFSRVAERVKRALPPEVFEFFTNTVVSGAAVTGGMTALYKLLKLWSEYRRGRKFKLKGYGIEIDATGISEKKFLELVSQINGLTAYEPKATLKELAKFEVPLRLEASPERHDDLHAIHNRIMKSRVGARRRKKKGSPDLPEPPALSPSADTQKP